MAKSIVLNTPNRAVSFNPASFVSIAIVCKASAHRSKRTRNPWRMSVQFMISTMPIPKIPARFFTTVPEDAPREIDLIVIHTTESDLHPGAARAVASWFASPSSPQASAHYVINQDEVVQCVEESNVAWGAPGGNAKGIQIELVGRAKWIEEWSGEDAQRMLGHAAELVRCIAKRYGIPLRKLDAEDLKFGARGVCGHVDVSRAWKKSDHFDPGQGFPWEMLIP